MVRAIAKNVTGFFDGSATFGAGETNTTTLSSAGIFDIFVAKYDASGDLVWAKRAGGTDFDEGLGIAVDVSGNSYVTGFFAGSATFGAGETNATTLTSAGSDEIFVAKYGAGVGSITIVKDTQPNGPRDFSFTTTGGLLPATFELDDDAEATLPNTQTYADIPAGPYSVTELGGTGFFASLSCTDPDCGTTTAARTRRSTSTPARP